jgi:hypothetical protein
LFVERDHVRIALTFQRRSLRHRSLPNLSKHANQRRDPVAARCSSRALCRAVQRVLGVVGKFGEIHGRAVSNIAGVGLMTQPMARGPWAVAFDAYMSVA